MGFVPERRATTKHFNKQKQEKEEEEEACQVFISGRMAKVIFVYNCTGYCTLQNVLISRSDLHWPFKQVKFIDRIWFMQHLTKVCRKYFALPWQNRSKCTDIVCRSLYHTAPHIMHSNWLMRVEVNLFECKWQERYLYSNYGHTKILENQMISSRNC